MLFPDSNFSSGEAALLQRASTWKHSATLENLPAEALCRISRNEGVDFATAVLFDRFCKSERRAPFIERIDTLRRFPPAPRTKLDARIVVIPGALYRERPEMGGDGRIVREVAAELGYETDLIPIASFGSMRTNAHSICEWFRNRTPEPVIIASLSKGSADLKMAMASADAAELFSRVIAWVNICGPLNGSRMADWILTNQLRTLFVRAQCLMQKRDFEFVSDLRHDGEALLRISLPTRPSMTILNVIGFPLRQHMTTRFSRFCHHILSRWGPNDGTTSLTDIEDWTGDVYPVWGADHYFRPETVAKNLVRALLCYLEETLKTNDAMAPLCLENRIQTTALTQSG